MVGGGLGAWVFPVGAQLVPGHEVRHSLPHPLRLVRPSRVDSSTDAEMGHRRDAAGYVISVLCLGVNAAMLFPRSNCVNDSAILVRGNQIIRARDLSAPQTILPEPNKMKLNLLPHALLCAALAAAPAHSTEVFDVNTGTLSINDLVLGGVSYSVTMAYQGQVNGQHLLAVSSLTPNNACSRGVYNAGGTKYYINTYTQNGISVGGIQRVGSGYQFTAAWYSGPISSNPFLIGHDTSGLADGAYGVVGAEEYGAFSNGDLVRVQGSESAGFTITNVTSGSSGSTIFFPPDTSSPLRALPCPSTSGVYYGNSDTQYQVTVFGSNSGAITRASSSGYQFTASWENNIGSVGGEEYSRFYTGDAIKVIDIGQSAFAIVAFDKSPIKARTVAVFTLPD